MRLNHEKFNKLYPNVGLSEYASFYLTGEESPLIVPNTRVAIGPDVFRFMVAWEEDGAVREDAIDYEQLHDEGIDEYDLKAVAVFMIERGESWEIHEEHKLTDLIDESDMIEVYK